MVITWQRGSEVEDRIKFANLVTLKYRLFWFIQVGSIPWILKCGGGRQQSQCQSDAERDSTSHCWLGRWTWLQAKEFWQSPETRKGKEMARLGEVS